MLPTSRDRWTVIDVIAQLQLAVDHFDRNDGAQFLTEVQASISRLMEVGPGELDMVSER